MKRLTHAELAAAHDRQDWPTLWKAALPLVKVAVRRLVRDGGTRTDDLMQEGALAAGEAIRSWRPIECALSTHLILAVRSALYDSRVVEGNHGIGSQKQSTVVLSIGDPRQNADARTEEDEADDDGSFDAALTYEGVVMPGGQFDGGGEAPEGLGNPEEEAARMQCESAIENAVARMSPANAELLRCVHGIGCPVEHPDAFAERQGMHRATVYRRLQRAELLVRQILPNFAHYR